MLQIIHGIQQFEKEVNMTQENKDKIKAFIYIMALVFFCWIITAYSKDEPLPQSIDGAIRYGCVIKQEQDTHWHTVIWVEFKGSRWEYLYSIRNENEELKSMKDCYEWEQTLKKRLAVRK